MDNTEVIKVLEELVCNMQLLSPKYYTGDNKRIKALSLAIQALKPLPTLEEIINIIYDHSDYLTDGFGYYSNDDSEGVNEGVKRLATAILDLLKGER